LLQEVALIVASDSGEGLESFIGIAKAVIYAMAAWLDLEGYVRAANDLREEVGQ
jgi:hypothetical protein